MDCERQVKEVGVYDYHRERKQAEGFAVPFAQHVQETEQISADGKMLPLKLIWENGKSYEIDRILRVDRCASLKAGGAGIRYVCRIQGQRVELYYEENGFWFVQRKVIATGRFR